MHTEETRYIRVSTNRALHETRFLMPLHTSLMAQKTTPWQSPQ